MASGLVVVAYDYAAAQQYVAHETSGLLAPFGDADAFISLSSELAAEPTRIARLRAPARVAAERIDWENVFNDFEAVLYDVMHRREAGYV